MVSRKGLVAGWLALAVAISPLALSPASAADQPLWEELKQRTKSEAFNIGALLQVVGTYENDPPGAAKNGFELANARLILRGRLDRSWGYSMQTSFSRSPAILDANVRFSPWGPLVQFRFGAMKAPFGAEFLTSVSAIDFVDRSQIVTAVVPGRQVGLQLGGRADMGLGFAVGVFNGNGLVAVNDNNEMMTVGRIFFRKFNDGDRRGIEAGIDAFYSNDSDAPIGMPITGDFLADGFTGKRRALGANARWVHDRWVASGEAIITRYDPRGGDRVEPWGYQATLGYGVGELVQVLARWDSFRPDGVLADSDRLVLGLNCWPTKPTEFQVNTVIPTKPDRDPQLLVNVQVAF